MYCTTGITLLVPYWLTASDDEDCFFFLANCRFSSSFMMSNTWHRLLILYHIIIPSEWHPFFSFLNHIINFYSFFLHQPLPNCRIWLGTEKKSCLIETISHWKNEFFSPPFTVLCYDPTNLDQHKNRCIFWNFCSVKRTRFSYFRNTLKSK